MYIVFICLAIWSFVFFYSKFRDFFHPNMLFLVIWFSACAISCVGSIEVLEQWSLEMYFVTIVSGVSFFVGALFTLGKGRSYYTLPTIKIPKIYRQSTYLFVFICFLCFFYEWNKGGRFSILTVDFTVSGDLKSGEVEAIPFIHYGTICLPYSCVLLLFDIFNEKKYQVLNFVLILFIIAVSIIVHVSRGTVLFILLSFIFMYTRYNILKMKYFLGGISLMVVGFVWFTIFRLNNNTSVVVTMTDNPYFSIFYSYIATCFANLNDLIQSDTSSHCLGNLTFSPLWTLLGVKDDMDMNSVFYNQLGIFNARTYLYSYFHDFQYIGIVIFPFIIGWGISNIYIKMQQYPWWSILLASLQKAIYTCFFGDYFFGDLVDLAPYIVMLFYIFIIISTYKNCDSKFLYVKETIK